MLITSPFIVTLSVHPLLSKIRYPEKNILTAYQELHNLTFEDSHKQQRRTPLHGVDQIPGSDGGLEVATGHSLPNVPLEIPTIYPSLNPTSMTIPLLGRRSIFTEPEGLTI